jgi:hypothetical protein
MVSTYDGNLWADTHGIDLDDLQREHPLHPDQLRLKRIITRKAEAYWARERFLARLEYSSQAILSDTPEPAPVKIRKKKARVNRYEFTDSQLAIAMRSLNEKGAV